jgi:hypothetical protein
LKKHTQFPHFEYLLQGNFMEVVENEPECASRVVEIARGQDRKRAARAAFVEQFIRPRGAQTPANIHVLNLLEGLPNSQLSAAPQRRPGEPAAQARGLAK